MLDKPRWGIVKLLIRYIMDLFGCIYEYKFKGIKKA